MHFVDMLRATDNSLYIGETPNVVTRVLKHNEGSASMFTAQPRRERQLKRRTRAKKEALLSDDLDLLTHLSPAAPRLLRHGFTWWGVGRRVEGRYRGWTGVPS